LERREADLARLETEYKEALLSALRECANGKWGLFGQYKGSLAERFRSESVRKLDEIGKRWKHLAVELGYSEPLRLMKLLEDHRGESGGNNLGEPRLAQKMLIEISEGEP
jgi:hypothetical protein